MKKFISIVAGCVSLCGVSLAQSADYSLREVRDPVQLKAALNADVTTITGRLVAIEATAVGNALAAGKIIVGSVAGVSAAVDMSGAATINSNGVVVLAGNIPFARITNALDGVSAFTGVITNGIGLAYTNRFCIYQGLITNVYITGP